jgi:hypothetical protein
VAAEGEAPEWTYQYRYLVFLGPRSFFLDGLGINPVPACTSPSRDVTDFLGPVPARLPVRRSLYPVQLGVGSAARHEVFVRAGFDEVRAVEDEDKVGHADGAEAVGDKEGDPSVLGGDVAVRGGGLVEHEEERVVAHEAARQRQLLPREVLPGPPMRPSSSSPIGGPCS